MTQQDSLRLQLTCVDLNDSSLQEITRQLAKSLNEQNIGKATLTEPATRAGAKGDPIAIGSIILALLGSGGVAVSLIQVLKAYVERKRTLQFEFTTPEGKKVSFNAENLADKDLMQNATNVMKQFIAS